MSHHINRFQLMAKPSGAVCNIDCTYCYYLEKQRLYPQRQAHWKMDGATLENYVRKNIASQPAPTVDFHWQGGEPTLLGIDFSARRCDYRSATAAGSASAMFSDQRN